MRRALLYLGLWLLAVAFLVGALRVAGTRAALPYGLLILAVGLVLDRWIDRPYRNLPAFERREQKRRRAA